MTGDRGFWAIQGKFDDYMSAMEKQPVKEDKAQKCHNFKAGDPSRSGGAKKAGATGMVLVSCARHSIVQANGIADLVKGEVFSRVDVPIATVIARQDPGQRQVISYDIACKYGVKFQERVSAPYTGGPLLEQSEYPKDLEFYVPAWHILGHTPQCNLRFNMRYHPLVGRTAGEGVETIWAVMNAYQYSTREMGHGHRRDTLTDIFNDFNFRKSRNEADRISKAYGIACQEYIRKEEELKDLEEGIPEEKLKAMGRESEARGTEQFASPESKLPSKSKVLQALRDAEDAEHSQYTDAPAHSEAMFISNAIDLLDLQYQVRVRSGEIGSNPGGDGKRTQFLLMQEQLRRRLVEHFETLFRIAPKLQDANLNQSLPPTLQSLYLPSEFSPPERRAYGLVELAKKEAQLQVANAHHALQEVRNNLGLKRLLVVAKKTHSSGQERNQRSETAIKKAEVVVKRHKASYQRSYDAIEALEVLVGVHTDAGNLQPLLDSDLRSLELYLENPVQTGLPWIWKTLGGAPSGSTNTDNGQSAVEDWNQEGSLGFMPRHRETDGGKNERFCMKNCSAGITAYAMRQGSVYQRLALHATAKFNEAMLVGSADVVEG
ncbi:hypothetical protein FRC04_005175 [Tulasnella sp. 424]|nr:hypothetical protein FRC04_005175 [Tulasnella sp. 424]